MLTINSTSEFFYAFRIDDFLGNTFYNLSYFEFRLKYSYLSINKSTGQLKVLNQTILDVSECNENHIDNNTLHENGLYLYYCADLLNLKIGGDFDSTKEVATITYQVMACSEQTEKRYNITCASVEQIREKSINLLFSYSN